MVTVYYVKIGFCICNSDNYLKSVGFFLTFANSIIYAVRKFRPEKVIIKNYLLINKSLFVPGRVVCFWLTQPNPVFYSSSFI